MTREEQMQKLSAISNYCCAQKDKDALDAAIRDCKKLDKIEHIYDSYRNFALDYEAPMAMKHIGMILEQQGEDA